jgi:hypothetical protein
MASKLLVSALVLALCGSLAVEAQPLLPTTQDQSWITWVWLSKVNNMFTMFDLNNNGLHDQPDVNMMVAGYASYGLIREALTSADMTALFAKLFACSVASVVSPTLQVGRMYPQNATLLQTCLADLGQTGVGVQIGALCVLFFPVFDTNVDLLIEQAEYEFFFTNLKLPLAVPQAAWPLFNPNSNNQINLAQFTAMWVKFFTTSNQADAWNGLLGPIPASNPYAGL